MTHTVSIRLSEDKISILNGIAQRQNDSRNTIMNEAIDNYIEMHQAWMQGIHAAIAQDDTGKTLPATQVFDELRNKFWK